MFFLEMENSRPGFVSIQSNKTWKSNKITIHVWILKDTIEIFMSLYKILIYGLHLQSWAGSNIFGQSGMTFQSQGGIMTFEQGPMEMNQTLSFGGGICTTMETNVIETQFQLCPTVQQSEFEFAILNPVQNPVSNIFHSEPQIVMTFLNLKYKFNVFLLHSLQVLPYTGPVLGGLKASMAMMLQGTVANNADQ